MKKSGPLSSKEYEVLSAFRHALREFLHFSEKEAREAGLSPQQHQALLAICGYGRRERITVGRLADLLKIKHHSSVELADRLMREGFLRRTADPDDRRRVFLELTAKGRQRLASLSAAHREELRRLAPRLTVLLKQLSRKA